MSKSAKKIDGIRQKMSELENLKIPTQEYKEYQKQLESAEKKHALLNDRIEKFKALGGKEDSKTFKSMQYDAEQLERIINDAKSGMQGLIESGEAFTYGSDTEKYKILSQQLAEEQANLNNLTAKYREYQAVIEHYDSIKENAKVSNKELVGLLEDQKELQEYINQLKQAGVGEGYKEYDEAVRELSRINEQIKLQRSYVNPLQSTINGLKESLSGLGSVSKKAFSSMLSLPKKAATGVLHLGKSAVKGIASFSKLQKVGVSALKNIRNHSKSAGSMMGSFGHRVLGLAKRVFVFSLITRGFRSMLSGIKEGLQNYMDYDASLKNSIEGLKASLNTVKANLGSAFAPIVQIVLPYLQMMIGWINTAINAVNQFISSILGRSTYRRASSGIGNISSNVSDMADNMGDATKQAKKLSKALANYDELNVIQRDTDTGSSSGRAGNDSDTDGLGIGYNDVAIDSKIKALSEKIKKYFSDIFKPVKDSWNKYGASVINSWKNALNNIGILIKALALTFRDVWMNGTGEKTCSNILLILKMIGDMIASISKAFTNAWNDNNRGYNYIQSLFNKFNAILSVIQIIGQSLLTVWNSGSGETAIGHLLDIFTNINNMIANIGLNFSKAWSSENTGTAIIQDLADLCNILLGHINNITKNLEKWTQELDFGPVLKSFNKITEALKPLGDKVGAGLEWFFENILQPLAKWAIEQGAPKALDAIASALDALNAVIDTVKPLFLWLWDNFLQPLAKWTGGAITGALEAVSQAFSKLADDLKNAQSVDEVIQAFLDIGANLVAGLLEGILGGLTDIVFWFGENVFKPIVNAVRGLFETHSPSKVFECIGNDLIAGLLEGLKNIPGTLSGILKNLWDKIQSAWKALGNITLEIGAKIKEKASDLWNTVKSGWQLLKNKTLEIGAKIKQTAQNLWSEIKTGWGTAKDKVVEIGVGIKETAANIWDKIKGLFSGKKTSTSVETDQTVNVGTKLVKSGWDSLEKFIGDHVTVKVKLKKGFSNLEKFIGTNVSIKVHLKKHRWKDIKSFVGTSVTTNVSLKKSGWKDIKGFVGNAVQVSISLKKSGWNDIKKFVGTSVTVGISLKLKTKLRSIIPNDMTVAIYLKSGNSIQSIIPSWVNVAVYFYAARSVQSLVPRWVEVPTYFSRRAVGGIFKNGKWKDIPQFASGGSAKGTLFYAGEAGPEIVGNAGGGQSEILNKSQIASAIYSAVVAGIRATLGNFIAVIAETIQNGSNDITVGIDNILNQIQDMQSNYGISIPTVNCIPDVNRINAVNESVSRTNISPDNTKLINALAEKIGGNMTIENIMYLDGKIVYKEMVDIDKMTVKQTGKSGFAY